MILWQRLFPEFNGRDKDEVLHAHMMMLKLNPHQMAQFDRSKLSLYLINSHIQTHEIAHRIWIHSKSHSNETSNCTLKMCTRHACSIYIYTSTSVLLRHWTAETSNQILNIEFHLSLFSIIIPHICDISAIWSEHYYIAWDFVDLVGDFILCTDVRWVVWAAIRS